MGLVDQWGVGEKPPLFVLTNPSRPSRVSDLQGAAFGDSLRDSAPGEIGMR